MTRAIGSGADTVRIALRSDQGGYRLFLGRALYQALGSPERLDVTTARGALALTAGDAYAVAGMASDGQPRLAIGIRAAADLGIEREHVGTYEARYSKRSGRALVRLKLHARPRPTGASLKALRTKLALSQAVMAERLAVPVATYRNWEARRRVPPATTRLIDAVSRLDVPA